MQDKQLYLSFMETAVRQWFEGCTDSGSVKAGDGTLLRYYTAIPEKPRAAVVIVHGFCEFFGKYHEPAMRFWQEGFAVFFCEHRGHGYSGGKLPEPDEDIVYIDDYRTYVSDLKCFLDQIVMPRCADLPKILFAHSMGGAIAALFLESYPEYFQEAIFSSPMFMLKTGKYPAWVAGAAAGIMCLTGRGRELAPGEKRFSDQNIFEKSSTLSRERYEYQFRQRVADRHYQTYGASYSWVAASLRATRKLLADAYKIRIPVSLMSAGRDSLVKREGFIRFMQKVPQTREYAFETSKHEIFNADDETVRAYYDRIFSVLGKYGPPGRSHRVIS
ncbi:MAG: alpha/beta hydrolase [Lachnospiraceae bacterium]|nr:alpha/beta hydrolase [Lachnospiraceae bacterium]